MAKPHFLRHALIYGLGSVIVQAASIFLLPIYIRSLSIAEYGTLDLLTRISDVAIIVLMFGGVRQAAFAFYGKSDSEVERRKVIASTLCFVLAVTFVGGAALLWSAGPLSDLLGIANPGLFRLTFVATLLEGMCFVCMVIPQMRVESVFFCLASVVQFFMRIVLCIYMVVFLEWGLLGIMWSRLIAAAVFVLYLMCREFRRARSWPDVTILRSMLRFSLPFITCGLCFFFLNNGDRFFLWHGAGEEEVGIYSFGYKLALVVGIFSKGPLCMVWCARMYEAAKKPNAPIVFGSMFTRIMAAYLFVGAALCIFQVEVVHVMGGVHYQRALQVIAPVVLAYFFLAAADLMESGLYIRNRTGVKTPIALASTAVMCVFYAWFIPLWGCWGAALATLLGFMVHAGLTYRATQRVFYVRYEKRRLVALLTLFLLCSVAAQWLPEMAWAIPVKIAILLSFPTVLWLGGFVSEEEREWARELAQGIQTIAQQEWLIRWRGQPQ